MSSDVLTAGVIYAPSGADTSQHELQVQIALWLWDRTRDLPALITLSCSSRSWLGAVITALDISRQGDAFDLETETTSADPH
jgi:hypothetical protein